jgi:hypothetical protein
MGRFGGGGQGVARVVVYPELPESVEAQWAHCSRQRGRGGMADGMAQRNGSCGLFCGSLPGSVVVGGGVGPVSLTAGQRALGGVGTGLVHERAA